VTVFQPGRGGKGGLSAQVKLDQGGRRVFHQTTHESGVGQIAPTDDRAAFWSNLPDGFADAFIVRGGAVEATAGNTSDVKTLADLYTAAPDAPLAKRLEKRLLEYWSRFTAGRARREWLIGWTPPGAQPNRVDGELRVVPVRTLWAIDLGANPDYE
jgi:hypothetical protein